MKRLANWLVMALRRIVGTIYVWTVCYELGTVNDTKRLAKRELDAIPESLRAHWDYQTREQSILTERLGRRYDLGMALNESANRAIEEKKVTRDTMPQLSGKQLAALEFQEKYLQGLVKKA